MDWKVFQELKKWTYRIFDDDDDTSYDRVQGIGLLSGRHLETTKSIWELCLDNIILGIVVSFIFKD